MGALFGGSLAFEVVMPTPHLVSPREAILRDMTGDSIRVASIECGTGRLAPTRRDPWVEGRAVAKAQAVFLRLIVKSILITRC
jgi:hypothetical protein